MTSDGWISIIGAICVGVGYIVKELAAGWGTRRVKDQLHEASGKLDVIHDLTNSSMTALKLELSDLKQNHKLALERIERMETANRRRRSTDTEPD